MEQLLPAEAAAPPGDDGQGAAPRTQPVMMLEPFDEVAVAALVEHEKVLSSGPRAKRL